MLDTSPTGGHHNTFSPYRDQKQWIESYTHAHTHTHTCWAVDVLQVLLMMGWKGGGWSGNRLCPDEWGMNVAQIGLLAAALIAVTHRTYRFWNQLPVWRSGLMVGTATIMIKDSGREKKNTTNILRVGWHFAAIYWSRDSLLKPNQRLATQSCMC